MIDWKIYTKLQKHFMFKVHFEISVKKFTHLGISKHFMFKVHINELLMLDLFFVISKHFMFKVHERNYS